MFFDKCRIYVSFCIDASWISKAYPKKNPFFSSVPAARERLRYSVPNSRIERFSIFCGAPPTSLPLPILLDEVHHLIETTPARFILTGSGARKLKRSGVNLLAGRAWQADLFPLVSEEIPDFDIIRFLRYGGLPQVYSSDYPAEELGAYIDTYLKEEIQAEVPNYMRAVPSSARHSNSSSPWSFGRLRRKRFSDGISPYLSIPAAAWSSIAVLGCEGKYFYFNTFFCFIVNSVKKLF